MKTNLLVVIDMQNDFIEGALENKYAQEIVPKICSKIESLDNSWEIILTQDTHYTEDYPTTIEGKFLDNHCIWKDWGWEINSKISEAISSNSNISVNTIEKNSFCYSDWIIENLDDYEDIYVCGTCTDICVISNVLNMQSCFPKTRFHVIANLCSGTTKENHNKAIDIMKNCFIDII